MDLPLVPAPVRAERLPGELVLDERSAVAADAACEEAARWLRRTLGASTGLALPPGGEGATIRLRVTDGGTGSEGFRLRVSAEGVDVRAADPAGAFYAAQAVRQLLGPAAFRAAPVDAGTRWALPCCEVVDAPRFAWRGVLLDVARHFLPKHDLLRFVDLAAAHRLNRLHLHLTDDQGWRFEVRQYPRLTEVGSWRRQSQVGAGGTASLDGRPHGGYYTQQDLREVVAYAAARHVEVVPEIDLPGHTQAAIAAYPELGHTTEQLEPWQHWGINENVLDVGDASLAFFRTVLDEVTAVFPSRWVHLGGDEVPPYQLERSPSAQESVRRLGLASVEELPSWFLRQLADHLVGRGRTAAVWDEILDHGAPDGALVFAWRGRGAGIAAAERGHGVVMCPEDEVYLDHRQSDRDDEPVPVGYVRRWEDVYGFDPRKGVPQALAERVLGGQGNLWSEHLDGPRRLDYMAWPRLAALAEALWTDPARRSVHDFGRRLRDAHLPRLDALGVEYRPLDGPRPWQTRPGVPGRSYEPGHEAGWAPGHGGDGS